MSNTVKILILILSSYASLPAMQKSVSVDDSTEQTDPFLQELVSPRLKELLWFYRGTPALQRSTGFILFRSQEDSQKLNEFENLATSRERKLQLFPDVVPYVKVRRAGAGYQIKDCLDFSVSELDDSARKKIREKLANCQYALFTE